MSFQIDTQFYGFDGRGELNAAGFHLTNLLFHIANVILLFLVLLAMTQALGPSALAAALFAVHPLHVESVAWVAERKDVLSTFFWLLTIGAYTRYARQPGLERYLLVLLALVLGLLAKPMLVTLPCVLLLLDYWPLRRLWSGRGDVRERENCAFVAAPARRLLLEKLPLFAVATAFGLLTIYAQDQTEAYVPWAMLSVRRRVSTALIGYVNYLRTTVWPAGLALSYPYPLVPQPWEQVLGTAVLLAAITAAVLWAGRRFPFLPVGWFWFLITMAPVSGLLQSGEQARADRFTYVPNMGLYIMVAWGLAELAARRRSLLVPAAVAAVALAACVILTRRQVGYWQNDLSIWQHGVDQDDGNYEAHLRLGLALLREGQEQEGLRHLNRTLELGYDVPRVRRNLGAYLISRGRNGEAILHLEEALRKEPGSAETRNALGAAYFQEGDSQRAETHLREAVRLQPDFVWARQNLAQLYLRLGRYAEAEREVQEVQRLNPPSAEGFILLGVLRGRQHNWTDAITQHRRAVELADEECRATSYQDQQALDLKARSLRYLAHALLQDGRSQEAAAMFAEASKLSPPKNWLPEAYRAGWKLAASPKLGQRDGAAAVELAEQVCQATAFQDAEALDLLAASLAQAGRFKEAVRFAERALEQVPAGQDSEMAARIRTRLDHYRNEKPLP
jgi:tetratricopeptide (TPR) repeat protein